MGSFVKPTVVLLFQCWRNAGAGVCGGGALTSSLPLSDKLTALAARAGEGVDGKGEAFAGFCNDTVSR